MTDTAPPPTAPPPPAAAEQQPAWPYPDIANPDLLDRIPLAARVILDVGCGTGALGGAFKRMNPRARVHGIEANLSAARIAATRLDEVLAGDVETTDLPWPLEGRVECLIYGDVLEHLRDPWAVLRKQAALLAPDGTVLACVPNIEHWSIVARLLNGRWDYEESGLLDRTHLRFFTRATTERALRAAGLEPVDCLPRVFDAERANGFANALLPALTALGIDPAVYAQRATPLQYLWRAKRRRPSTLHVVGTMLPPVGGVSQVRVLDPLRCVATDPEIRTQISNGTDIPPIPPDEPRIWIFHRPALVGPEGLRTLRTLLRRGFVTVTEFDDHPDYIPILQRPDMWNFRGVHAVQTSTMELAERLRQDNPEIGVFPNGLRALPTPRNHAAPPRLSLFFGCLNREGDWPPALDALNQAAAAAGERLHFDIVHDRKLFEALETPHKTFSPTLEYAPYLDRLARCEISFMPLADTPFNRAKSDLKFIEAASLRVCALASPVAYGGSIQDGRTGLLFRDNDELRRHLLHLVANPDQALTIGENARAWVAGNRMLAYQTAARVAWYHGLWARRDSLTRALLQRLPTLAE